MTGVPRYISSITSDVARERRITFVAARAIGYGIPRCIEGSTPRRCDLVDCTYSLITSPIVSTAARRYLSGLTKNEYQALLWPNPCVGSLIVDIVMYDRAASPDTRLPTLAPLFDSSPSPFEA